MSLPSGAPRPRTRLDSEDSSGSHICESRAPAPLPEHTRHGRTPRTRAGRPGALNEGDPVTNFDMFKSRGLALVVGASILALAAGGGGAVAGSLITSQDIQDKTIKTADLKKGAVKTQKVQDGTLGVADLSKQAQDKFSKPGPQGPPGPAGGPPGPAGPHRSARPARNGRASEYGVAQVCVDRGNGPSRFAAYSAALGSPAGTTTGGHFRFTCTPSRHRARCPWVRRSFGWPAPHGSIRGSSSTASPALTTNSPLLRRDWTSQNNVGITRSRRCRHWRQPTPSCRRHETWARRLA